MYLLHDYDDLEAILELQVGVNDLPPAPDVNTTEMGDVTHAVESTGQKTNTSEILKDTAASVLNNMGIGFYAERLEQLFNVKTVEELRNIDDAQLKRVGMKPIVIRKLRKETSMLRRRSSRRRSSLLLDRHVP